MKATMLAPAAITAGAALAIDPIKRVGPPQFKLSLAAYGFRKYLDLKKAAEPRMDYFQFADLAAQLGLGAIEATSYYMPETTSAWLSKFKNHCTRLGLDISASAVANDFCLPDVGKRKADIKRVKEWLDISGFLGAKSLRVFAGNTPKEETEDTARKRCIDALQEVSEHAAKTGVFVAVENHGGITATPEQLLAIVINVKHEWFGVNLDTHNFKTADPYGDVAKLAPYAVNVQMKTEVKIAGEKNKQEADLPRLFGILKSAGYRGYVALEYEAGEDPKTAVPRHVKRMQEIIKGIS